MKNIYILTLLLLVGVSLKSQINLNTQHLGTQTYDIAAPEYVRMLPGFEYIPKNTNYFRAYIDPNASLVLPIEYVEIPIDPEDRYFNTTDYKVGSTPGQASVSLSGGATYTIPIFAPPGTAGMQPSVSLVYNSQGGNGIAGYGWNISGLSAITRIGHTIYHDEAVKGVDFNDDRFALDGQRLIKTLNTATYGANGTTYYTEVFNGSKIISHDVTGQGPQWFEVVGKDGSIIEYGKTDNARLTSQRSDQTTITWYISKITDPNGNYIQFLYDKKPLEINIKEIQYTGNNGTTPAITPYNSIKFYYRERTDESTAFIAGSRLEQTVLLDHIDVVAESQIIKVYKLKHYFDFYSKLNEVEEYGLNSERYNSLVFGYDDDENQSIVSNTNIDLGSAFYKEPVVIHADFNNDGLADMFRAHVINFNFFWSLFYNKGNGEFDENNPDMSGNLNDNREYTFATCDINADGYLDLFFSSKWNDFGTGDAHYSLQLLLNSNGIEFLYYDVLNEDDLIDGYDDLSVNINSLDIDGDNRDELLINTIRTNSATNSPRLKLYDIEINNNILTKQMLTNISTGNNDVAERLIAVDLDGDSKDEVLITLADGLSQIYKFNYYNNQYHDSRIYTGYPFNLEDEIYPGDYNGDGRIDLLIHGNLPSNGTWSIAYWLKADFIIEDMPPLTPGNGIKYQTNDYNGDGKTDLATLCINFTDNKILLALTYIDYNTAYQDELIEIMPLNNPDRYSLIFYPHKIIPTDFNGDGISDVCVNVDDLLYHIILNPLEKKNLLKICSNGFNYISSFQYSTLTDANVYQKTSSLVYPLNVISYPINVVSSIKYDNGLSGYSTMFYKYSDAILHLQGKGFLGFKGIRTSSSISPIYNFSESDVNTDYNFLYPKASESYKMVSGFPFPTKLQISENTITNQIKTGFETTNKVFLPWQSLVTEKDFVTGNKKTTELTTDNYGNPLIQKVKFFDSHSATTEKAYNQTEYQNYWSAVGNIASKPQTIINTSYRIEQALITQTQTIKYDAKGNIEHTIDFFGRTNEVKTTYTEPTSVGLPKTTTVSALGIQDRVSHKEFDSKYRFVSSQTDAEGYVSSTQYDPAFGNKLSVTNANEQTISMEYNGFGAPIRQTDDFGVWSETGVRWYTGSTKPNVLYYTESTSNNGLTSARYYDKLGRTLYATSTDPNGMVSCIKTEYNSKGQAISVSEPYFEGTSPTQYTTTNYHPDYGFPLSTTLPTGVIVTSSTPTPESPGRVSSVTNSVTGITTSKEVDCTGKIIAATDPGGTLNYIYYSDGQTKQINAPDGSNVSITYDDYGRQQTLSDPDAGIMTYTYDALGQLIQQEDANGSIFMMQYDKLGRLIEKESEKNNQVANQVYIYYPATAAIGSRGALNYTHYADEENADTRDTYQYNDKGQLTQKTTVTDNNTISFSYLYSYDTKGNLDEYTYPSGYTIKNEYNSENGTLERVKEKLSGKIIYSPGSYNARGQMDHYSIANQSMYTRSEYDLYGLPTFIKTGHSYPGSTDIQYLETQFDAQTGNLNYRKDHQVNGQVLSETFTYDPMHKNRLASWQVTGQPQFTMTYADNNGNILTKSDITSTNNPYQYTGPKPHAVTGIQAPLLLPAENLQTIDYNHFNSVKQIMHNAEGKRLVLQYGTDGQRIKTQYFTQNITLAETKYFIGGDYEVEINHATGNQRRIHYLPGGGMYVLDQNDNGVLYYILTDYLGNWHKVINEQGSTIERYNFDPWGRRRHPDNWNIYYVSSSYIFDRGYTGHEMLDAFGLINMNGRVYDPIIARFLSPDNYVQGTSNSQGFNRYSYCLNNPLIFTDPDGENPILIMIAMQAIISGINSSITGDGFLQGFAMGAATSAISAGVGAGIGAIIGPLFTSSGGVLPGMVQNAIPNAIGGLITYGSNSAISGQPFDWEGYAVNVGAAALLGGVKGGIDAHAYNRTMGPQPNGINSVNIWSGKQIGWNRNEWSLFNWDKATIINFEYVHNTGKGVKECQARASTYAFGGTEDEWIDRGVTGNDNKLINVLKSDGCNTWKYYIEPFGEHTLTEKLTYEELLMLHDVEGRAYFQYELYGENARVGHSVMLKKIYYIPNKRFDIGVYDPYMGNYRIIKNPNLGDPNFGQGFSILKAW